jgi:hypothetical protein
VVNLLLDDVQRLELRKRAPGQGALVGGGVGGLTGGLFIVLLCTFVAEGGSVDVLPCAGIGALLGGSLGASIGALIGLAVPRWSTVYEKEEQGALSLHLEGPEDDVLSHWFSGSGPVGEVGLQVGYARDFGISQPTGGWGGRLHLLALLGPYIAVGPEVAWYNNVGSLNGFFTQGPSFQERSLFELGGLVRGGMEIGPTRTFVLLGLGLHDNQTSHVGASAGGEVEVRFWEQLPPLAFNVRYDFDVDRDEFEPAQNFLTFGLGTRLRW